MAHDPAATVISTYRRQAAGWTARRSQALMERAWLDAFVAALPGQGREVLDLGCGTGQPIAAWLVARGMRVTGVDGAAEMIAEAGRHLPGPRWIVADMRALPPLGRFHGVITWHSFFHLRPAEQRVLLAQFATLLEPGGVLMFTSGTAEGESIGTMEGEPLYHGSLDTAEYRRRLEDHGFEVLRHVESDPACGGATVWLARRG